MKLFIKPHNDTAWEFYRNHGHFHDGDAGLDLYVLDNIQFEPGETKAIKLGISCESEDGKAYYLFPRSSISKTPLRMANSIGLIDGGYRGEIIAMCDNIKSDVYTAEKGQRLFQLVVISSSSTNSKWIGELSVATS
jgi:dUTP pyrophosphatase